jgi:hypothetical protein
MRSLAVAALAVCLFAPAALADAGTLAAVSWFIDDDTDFPTDSGGPPDYIAEVLWTYTEEPGHVGQAYANLVTGAIKAKAVTNNYTGRGDVISWGTLTDTVHVETDGARTVAEVVLSMAVQGTLTVNTDTADGSGNVGFDAEIYGNNVDFKWPDFGRLEMSIDKQPGQPLDIDSWTLTEGQDYTVSGDTVTIDALLETVAEFNVADDPLPINWDLSVSAATGSLNGDPDRRTEMTADFWGTAVVGVELADGYEDFTLVRSSGLPEPATLVLLASGAVAALARRWRQASRAS